MSTLSPATTPLDSLNTARASQARDTVLDKGELKTTAETEKVAKKFEALLIHNMLKAMRTTTLGDKPSNERAMYDDMFDQEISKKLSESGGLGIASSIARQLNLQNGIEESASQSMPATSGLNMNALSNHPNTLARNGTLSSELASVGQYQAIMNRVESAKRLAASNGGSLGIDSLTSAQALGQPSLEETKKQFIDNLMPDAKRSAARLGVEPNVVVAIAALETGWGKHMIKNTHGASSHNLFGIKAHGLNTPYTMHKTTEFIDNKPVTVDAAFRQYDSDASAINDFADFLLANPRYETALKASDDNIRFLRELQSAGYATDPEYANKAISVLRQIEAIEQGPAL